MKLQSIRAHFVLAFSAFLLPAVGAAAAITGVLNNYSYTAPGFPNAGITPSGLFIITGAGLANPTSKPATLQSTAPSGF